MLSIIIGLYIPCKNISADDYSYRYESENFKYKDVKFTINGEEQKAWKYHEKTRNGSYEEKTEKDLFLFSVSDKEQKLKLGI